jgi:hypothetical protein
MTEAEWLSSEDPAKMFDFLRPQGDQFSIAGQRAVVVSERKLRLMGAAVWHAVKGDDPTATRSDGDVLVYDTACRVADGLDQHENLLRITHAMFVLTHAPLDAASELLRQRRHRKKKVADIVRCCCNPWAPRLVPHWLTPQVKGLAFVAYEDRRRNMGVARLDPRWPELYVTLDPDGLAVLHDALLDAGCESTGVYSHLRSPAPHYKGCWVLDLLFGRE